MKRTRYKKKIGKHTYYVRVKETFLYTTVTVRSNWSRERSKTYSRKRKFFCNDVAELSAKTLSEAVQVRQKNISEKKRFNDKIERSLDIVKEEYESYEQ